MNSVTLIGRLTRDPELRMIQSGQAVARFSIAVDKQLSRDKKQEMEANNQPTADFINIVVWGKLAENCSKYTSKGKRVAIQGRIQTGSYMDKDNKRVYTTDVVASNVEFLDWNDSTNQTGGSFGANQMDQSTGNDGYFGDDFKPIDDDERIPF